MNTELQGSIASGDEFSDVVEVASQILEGFGMTVDKNGILHKWRLELKRRSIR